MRHFAILTALYLVTALHGSGCDTLDEYQLGRCGNAVLEPLGGEDCDTFHNNIDSEGNNTYSFCIPPGAPNQCRYGCTLGQEDWVPVEGSTETPPPQCPKGWSCGIDEVCRKSAGTFEEAVIHDISAGDWLALGDVDNDGYDDIVWQYNKSVGVDFFSAGLRVSHTSEPVDGIGFSTGKLADVDGDGLLDVTIPSVDGLAVFRSGGSSRTLLPTTFASIKIKADDPRFFPLDLVPDFVMEDGQLRAYTGDEGVLVQGNGNVTNISGVPVVGTIKDDSGDIAEIVAGELDTFVDAVIASPSTTTPEEFVAVFENQNYVKVYHPRLVDPSDGPLEVDIKQLPPTLVSLANSSADVQKVLSIQSFNPAINNGDSAIACGANFAPGDDHNDLLLIGTDDIDGTRRMYVAYGLGNGTFHSDPCALDNLPIPAGADNTAALHPPFSNCGEPLAVADLDQDGQPDIITETEVDTDQLNGNVSQIHLSSLASAADVCDGLAINQADGSRWTQIAVDDFTGDGQLDVIAASEVGTVDFYEGGGGKLALTALSSTINGTHLATGDFDGDGVNDLAIADSSDPQDKTDRLLLMYGVANGPPQTPVEVGTLPSVIFMTPLTFRPTDVFADDADDLLVFVLIDDDPEDNIPPAAATALLRGRPDRNVQAPFLQAYGFGEIYAPLVATVGHFFAKNGDEGPPSVAMVGLRAGGGPQGGDIDVSFGVAKSVDNAQLQLVGEQPATVTIPIFSIQPPLVAHTSDLNGDQKDDMLFQYSVGPGAPRMLITAPKFTTTSDASDVSWSAAACSIKIDDASSAGGSGLAPWSRGIPDLQSLCHFGDPTLETPDGATLAVGFVRQSACGADEEIFEVTSHVALATPAMLKALYETDVDTPSECPNLGEPATLQLPPAAVLLGLDCADINGDNRDELLLLTFDDFDQCNPAVDPSDYHATIYVVDFASETPTPVLLVQWDQTTLPSLTLQSGSAFPPISSLAAGDINGDRIVDLVFGARNTTITLLGQVAPPQ